MSITVAPAPAPIRLRPAEADGLPETFKRRKRGLIYVRVSQARADMISPELQVGHAQALADANDIDVILEPIMDLGESGREFEERKIEEIKQMARDKVFDVLILWIWSRFGRNLRESLQHLDALMDYGVEVRAAKEDFDGKTTIGRFAIAQMLNIAELESNQKADMWRDTFERRRNRGLPHANRGKFGYYRCLTCPKWEFGKKLETCPRCRPGILNVDPVTGPVLAQMYRDYAAGISVRKIVMGLNRRGFTTFVGKPWTSGDLHATLDTGFGLGFVRYLIPELGHKVITREDGSTKKKRVNRQRDITAYLYYGGAHKAVIDDPVECERLWDAYTKRRMTQSRKHHFTNQARYSLSSHLRCSGCGGRMQTALRGKKHRRPLIDGLTNPLDVTFRCANHIDNKSCPLGGVYISLAVAEKRFQRWLAQEAAMDAETSRKLAARMAKIRAQGDENDDYLKRLSEIEAQLADIRREEDKLTDAVLEELISKDAARRKRAELETQKGALLKESAELQDKIKNVPKVIERPDQQRIATALEVYSVAGQADRRELAGKLIREIRVHPGKDTEGKIEVYPLWVAPPPRIKPALAA
ncbi:recombinase family protein [Streptomyces sp. NPDC053079]|uniref:recombinase family protein n=1 Tax=Streptomyces sp. NPDC053079 TaxID=3365697 RepID=UPI0037D6C550